MKKYYRPICQSDSARPAGAMTLAGGWCWFDHVEVLERGRTPKIIPAIEVPSNNLEAITSPRADIADLSIRSPRVMGILNVTPDSFSDGGEFRAKNHAIDHAAAMVAAGADILDIGGESTRPGAAIVPLDEEISRTAPVISGIRKCIDIPISIDTRKASVARAAIEAGSTMVNDVSALNYDAQLAEIASNSDVPICLMHASGTPENMQDSPSYDDVVLDVFDALSQRIEYAVDRGISRDRIVVDPGIGFGKTLEHNLALLRSISLFHGLGCPILLGVSRKRFIGTISGADDPKDRMPGSVALALAGIAQGVQITRVHDVVETVQAVALWSAAIGLRND